MKTSKLAPLSTHLAALFLLAACSSNPSPDTADATATAAAPSAPTAAPTSAPTSTTAPVVEGTATPTAAPSSTGAAPMAPAIEEVAKEANALVLDISIEAAGGELPKGDKEKLLGALLQSIAKVSDIGVPTSKGITGNRHVTARLIMEPVTETKDGYTQKAKLVGITTDGKCPLFDLDANAKLTTTAKKPVDVDDVRAAAVEQVFNKLEAQAKTLKPHGACTSEKAWK